MSETTVPRVDADARLRVERIEKLRLENAARRGELLDRREVVAGFVARAQQMIKWLEDLSGKDEEKHP